MLFLHTKRGAVDHYEIQCRQNTRQTKKKEIHIHIQQLPTKPATQSGIQESERTI